MAFGYVAPERVWVPSSGTIALDRIGIDPILFPETNEQILLAEAVRRKQPATMILTYGVNGVSYLPPTILAADYEAVIDAIRAASPKTRIILQSIFPVATDYELLYLINNNRINQANLAIAELASRKGCKYLDTASALKGSDGNLRPDLDSGDGMHLYFDAYDMIMRYIRTHAWIDGAAG
jgi:lysophospholipase L1-like esterase